MSNKPKKSEPKQKSANVALKYSGMAFQMAVTIGIGVFAGKQLDNYLENEKGICTAIGAFLGLIIAFYLILKDLK